MRDVLVSCPPSVEAGEEGGVHQLKSLTDLFVFNKSETSRRLTVNRKKLHLGNIFHMKLFQKYKMNFGVLLNKTISEWQGQNFPCYNKMNRNGARTVADQNVATLFQCTLVLSCSCALYFCTVSVNSTTAL